MCYVNALLEALPFYCVVGVLMVFNSGLCSLAVAPAVTRHLAYSSPASVASDHSSPEGLLDGILIKSTPVLLSLCLTWGSWNPVHLSSSVTVTGVFPEVYTHWIQGEERFVIPSCSSSVLPCDLTVEFEAVVAFLDLSPLVPPWPGQVPASLASSTEILRSSCSAEVFKLPTSSPHTLAVHLILYFTVVKPTDSKACTLDCLLWPDVNPSNWWTKWEFIYLISPDRLLIVSPNSKQYCYSVLEPGLTQPIAAHSAPQYT